MRFIVTYKDGASEEIEFSDCATVEAVINRMFGLSAEAAAEHGVSVVEVGGEIGDPIPEIEPEEPNHEEEPVELPVGDIVLEAPVEEEAPAHKSKKKGAGK